MMIIGGGNKGRVLGKSPRLDKLDKEDLVFDIHFREVYASILQNNLAFDPKKIGIKEKALAGLF
jgi:hypothetical protein